MSPEFKAFNCQLDAFTCEYEALIVSFKRLIVIFIIECFELTIDLHLNVSIECFEL